MKSGLFFPPGDTTLVRGLSLGSSVTSHKVLYENGLSTPRYVSGDNWWIEPFYETVKDGITTVEMAKLLAKIHKCPTDWYKPFREQLKKIHPVLQKTTDNSFMYAIMKSNWMRLNSFDDPFVQEHLIEYDKFIPRSEVGRRIVSKHNDFHHGNILNLKAEKK